MKRHKFYDNSDLDTLESGTTSHRQEKLAKAIACYTEALVMSRKMYGDQHPKVAIVLNK